MVNQKTKKSVNSVFRNKIKRLIKTLINDPPLQERDGGASTFSTIQEILDCDVVTLHVPYNEVGEFPTKDLFDEEKLKRLRTSVLNINTARGGVINELDLLKVIKERDDLYQSVADYVVDTENKSSQEVASEIVNLVKA